MTPRYPVYVISKGRSDYCLTPKFLAIDGVPFKLVVEPPEYAQYADKFPQAEILQLPFHDLGQGSIPARNWVREHAVASGALRHWIVDDNIRRMLRFHEGLRIPIDAGAGLSIIEDFADRYENVAIAGPNYRFFCRHSMPPFYLNVHVYSCMLILNSLPFVWRGRYNEDTDLCLQALSAGWCTVLTNAILIEKLATMTRKGGNTDELYAGDGRLKMARSLERQWPGLVETKRRFRRPQHVVKEQWRMFTQPLKRKDGVVLPDGPDDYGLRLRADKPTVKHPRLQALLEAEKKV